MKKLFATFLAILMLVQMLPVAVLAVGTPPLSLVTTVNEGSVTVNVTSAEEFTASSMSFNISVPSGCSLTSIAKGADFDSTFGGSFIGNVNTNQASCTSSNAESDTVIAAGKELVTLTFTVNSDATDIETFTFSITNVVSADVNDEETAWSGGSVTSNAVNNPIYAPDDGGEDGGSTTTDNYEIWYELSGTTFNGTGDTDDYTDYNIGDPVTATVKLKNNTAEPVTVQAYDIYLTHSDKLTYVSESLIGDWIVENGKTHIQMVKGAGTVELAESGNTDGGDTADLGTITFSIASDAAYDEALPITITDGSDSEDVTNISLANTDTVDTQGKVEAFYPVDTTEVDGVEVMTTYEVKWMNGDNTLETDAAVPMGNQPVYNGTTPTKEADEYTYTFVGWATEDGQETGKQVSELPAVTGNVTYYAAFSKIANTHTITFKPNYEGATQADVTQTVNHNDSTTLKTNTFSREGYTFVGWNTQDDGKGTSYAATDAVTLTSDLTLYAQWTINKYTITFVDEDDTVLKEATEYDYGTKAEDIVKPANPSKEATAQHTYEFAGWDPTVADVTDNATYKATYKATTRKYTIKFVNEDGTELQSTEVEYGATPAYTGATPTKDADNGYKYTFKGWGTVEPVTGEKTYTAQYDQEAIQYTITFNPNGGAVENGTSSMNYTIEDSITLPGATLAGKNFGGWSVVNSNGTSWTADNYSGTVNAGMYGNVTLKAVWTDKPLTIAGDGTNGTVSVSNADNASGANANEGDTINITLSPANGYEYTDSTVVQYTYTNDNGESVTKDATKDENGTYFFVVPDDVKPVDGTDITVSVTLTAINYTITYDLDGGEVAGTNPEKYTIESEDITLVAPTKEGYTFAGWTGTDLTEATKDVTIAKDSTGNREYTATWTVDKYTITYDLDGGEVAETNPVEYTIESEAITLVNPTKEGYTFAGWTGTGLDAATMNVTIAKGSTGNREYTATWTANTYTVTLDANGGNVNDKATDTISVTYGGTYGDKLVDPSRDGYDFKGWFVTVNEVENQIKADSTVAIANNHTLTAKWEAKEYTIKFVDSDGTTEIDKITAAYESSVNKPQDPSKPGYTFDKWVDKNGSEVTFPVTMPIDGMTVEATWTAIQYTIKFMDGETELTELKMSYNIESTKKLPGYDKANYVFSKWEVTTPDGNWKDVATIDADTAVTGYYGNVTLTAQWTREAIVAVEQYKYADEGQWLIRISDNLNDTTKTYELEGVNLFYMTAAEDTNKAYLVNDSDSGVFYGLVSEEYLKTDENGNVIAELKDDEFNALKGVSGTRNKIDYTTGDINGDGVTNIADANVVYQMTIHTGTYYADNLLSDAQRLMADMDRADGGDHRATIEDVDTIVRMING